MDTITVLQVMNDLPSPFQLYENTSGKKLLKSLLWKSLISMNRIVISLRETIFHKYQIIAFCGDTCFCPSVTKRNDGTLIGDQKSRKSAIFSFI